MWYHMDGLQAIYLSVCGSTLDPSTVSQLLDLTPTHSLAPGVDSWVDLDGSVFESAHDGQWTYRWDTDSSAGALLPQLVQRLRELELLGAAWDELRAGYTATLCLGITPELGDAFAITRAELPGDLPDRMRALGLKFAIRIEFSDVEDDITAEDL